jgi:hypothetical protein
MTSFMARASACLLVLALAPMAGCKGEDKALPDPARAPKPTVGSITDAAADPLSEIPPRSERVPVAVAKRSAG